MSLQFLSTERFINDTLIFPSFDLTIDTGKVIAINSSVNVREELIKLLLGKTKLSKGEILLEQHYLSESRQKIGLLFLNIELYERLSIEEILTFTKRLYGTSMFIEEILHIVQLESRRNVRIHKLSYSEKKRVQLACLLIQNPAVYIMEEPDQNLDIESKRILLNVLQHLRQLEKCILVLTGNMESAITLASEAYRLDENGLHSIQIQNEDDTETVHDEESTIDHIQPVRFEKIPTKVNEKIVLFNPPEIDYIESNEGQSFLHIKGETFPCVFTLTELEQRLNHFGFFRCHRSYIVNLQKVREVITWTRNSYSLVLDDSSKSTVPLSKSKMAELKEMLGF
ncbi:LytTR family transcriptional regulator DNA-binding domain-containing protein [Bacillus sp. FJAT-49711]|uniref:response regulator transcription factor n=1 Tax=Bacillus sp. FJAT-49711 TaxID=2833585 RepID=UPI001BCA3912|nr:LytTR family transcriptional regulator DNA-binding domain-containing protein [Bacillus sp. FJAT-49711]MBS4220684.1 LytTR family transcriptional regulator DNA-binding domain-containing protein [Bacillus sp. FJAT-49711]